MLYISKNTLIHTITHCHTVFSYESYCCFFIWSFHFRTSRYIQAERTSNNDSFEVCEFQMFCEHLNFKYSVSKLLLNEVFITFSLLGDSKALPNLIKCQFVVSVSHWLCTVSEVLKSVVFY